MVEFAGVQIKLIDEIHINLIDPKFQIAHSKEIMQKLSQVSK